MIHPFSRTTSAQLEIYEYSNCCLWAFLQSNLALLIDNNEGCAIFNIWGLLLLLGVASFSRIYKKNEARLWALIQLSCRLEIKMPSFVHYPCMI